MQISSHIMIIIIIIIIISNQHFYVKIYRTKEVQRDLHRPLLACIVNVMTTESESQSQSELEPNSSSDGNGNSDSNSFNMKSYDNLYRWIITLCILYKCYNISFN